jgi:hypothetical protein
MMLRRSANRNTREPPPTVILKLHRAKRGGAEDLLCLTRYDGPARKQVLRSLRSHQDDFGESLATLLQTRYLVEL